VRFVACAALFAASFVSAAHGDSRQPIPPSLAWAYPSAPEAPLPEAPPGTYTVPGSRLSFTAAQINEHTPDWFPNEHPPVPPVVAIGGAHGPEGCAQCHNYNGAGFIGIPSLAGLPAAYIVEQIKEFRAGRRRSAQPDRPAAHVMTLIANQVTDADLATAAAYFAALPRPQWYRTVETTIVPATLPNYHGWRDAAPGGGTEALGERIVELPEDAHRMLWLSDPHSGVVVYVPPGAIARGATLAHACAACHGAALRGTATVPPLAGRSAAYLARELWDIKTGARDAAPMRPAAARLDPADITPIAAYLASLPP